MSWENYSDEMRKASKAMNEGNDCTVIAWSNCFDAPYSHSHFWMKKHGRRNRHGMLSKEIKKAFENCKKAKIRVGPYTKSNRISRSTFRQDEPCRRH